MTKDEALRLALEALEKLWNIIDDIDTYSDMAKADEKLYRSLVERRQRQRFEETGISTDGYELHGGAITAIKAALEAKYEPVNDELRRLHDLLGKANALARIRANKIDELEQRLTKTEAQLGEAVWNYGELKREQLANQQKTSGSPINTSTALEAKDEPVTENGLYRLGYHNGYGFGEAYGKANAPQRTWVGLTDDEKYALCKRFPFNLTFDAIAAIEAALEAPQRTWVGLTDEEIGDALSVWELTEEWPTFAYAARAIEAKLKELNT